MRWCWPSSRAPPAGRTSCTWRATASGWSACRTALRFFAPEREVLVFPAWDCLPYDRLSPHPDIVAERLETLVRLAAPKKPGAPARIILASVGAALQKVPPRSLYAEAAVVLRKGQTRRCRLADEVPRRERLRPRPRP